MGNAHHMEALFIDARHRGSGVGRLLVEDALRRHPNLSNDVNEQNRQAVGFDERMGFERCGRSALDGQGRSYPLIHLRYQQPPPRTAARENSPERTKKSRTRSRAVRLRRKVLVQAQAASANGTRIR